MSPLNNTESLLKMTSYDHFLSFAAGNHASVRHHQRKVLRQHQELDTQHRGGTCSSDTSHARTTHARSDLTSHSRVDWLSLQHASSDVERMILGNKCDMNDKRQVSKERGEKVRALNGDGALHFYIKLTVISPHSSPSITASSS